MKDMKEEGLMRKLKRRLRNLATVMVILGIWLVATGNNLAPAQAQPIERPNNCQTVVSSGFQGLETKTYYRCASFNSSGQTLHLWHGDQNGPTEEEHFGFVAKSDFKSVLGSQRIQPYVYRNLNNPNHYVAIGLNIITGGNIEGINVSHNYNADTTTDGNWILNKPEDQNYSIRDSDETPFPEYQNLAWRIVINGTVKLNNTPKSGANIRIKLNPKKGPPLDAIDNGVDGKFEFSRVGINEDTWVANYYSDKIWLYTTLEDNGQKYEAYRELSFRGDFREHHNHGDTLVDKINDTGAQENTNIDQGPIFNLTQDNVVAEFSESTSRTGETVPPGETGCSLSRISEYIPCILATTLNGLAQTILKFALVLIEKAIGL